MDGGGVAADADDYDWFPADGAFRPDPDRAITGDGPPSLGEELDGEHGGDVDGVSVEVQLYRQRVICEVRQVHVEFAVDVADERFAHGMYLHFGLRTHLLQRRPEC